MIDLLITVIIEQIFLIFTWLIDVNFITTSTGWDCVPAFT